MWTQLFDLIEHGASDEDIVAFARENDDETSFIHMPLGLVSNYWYLTNHVIYAGYQNAAEILISTGSKIDARSATRAAAQNLSFYKKVSSLLDIKLSPGTMARDASLWANGDLLQYAISKGFSLSEDFFIGMVPQLQKGSESIEVWASVITNWILDQPSVSPLCIHSIATMFHGLSILHHLEQVIGEPAKILIGYRIFQDSFLICDLLTITQTSLYIPRAAPSLINYGDEWRVSMSRYLASISYILYQTNGDILSYECPNIEEVECDETEIISLWNQKKKSSYDKVPLPPGAMDSQKVEGYELFVMFALIIGWISLPLFDKSKVLEIIARILIRSFICGLKKAYRKAIDTSVRKLIERSCESYFKLRLYIQKLSPEYRIADISESLGDFPHFVLASDLI